MRYQIVPVTPFEQNCTLFWCENTRQAVVIDQGVWHGACLPVGRVESSYFVIFRRHTPHQDVEKKAIPVIEILER